MFSLSLKGAKERMSKHKSCKAHTHLRALAGPSGLPGLSPGPRSPGGGWELSGVISLAPRHYSMNLAAAAGTGPRSEAAESHWPPGRRGAAAPQRQPGQLSAPEKMGLPEDVTDRVLGSS